MLHNGYALKIKNLGKRLMPKAKLTLPESKLQEAVVALLKLYARQDICWWACPNGDYRHPAVGARLKRQGVKPGAADLMFVIDNMFHGLELKTEIGVMTANQQDYARELQRAGGVFHVAYGLQEALEVLRDIEAFYETEEFHRHKRTLLSFTKAA